VIEAKRVPARFGGRLVKLATTEDPAHSLDALGSCSASLVGNDLLDLKIGIAEMIFEAQSRDHVGLDAHGRCAECGEPCPGLFDSLPGTWGAGRERLIIRAA
jgi:hypothetical protein